VEHLSHTKATKGGASTTISHEHYKRSSTAAIADD
jgi:hypothetical protein